MRYFYNEVVNDILIMSLVDYTDWNLTILKDLNATIFLQFTNLFLEKQNRCST